MPVVLRDYQQRMKSEIFDAWRSGNRNVLAVAPTGAGKTALKSAIFAECAVPGCAIAHRQELVGQISGALADIGVYHRIIAPKPVVQFIIGQHVKKHGRSFHHNQSPMGVAGIDTLLRRADKFVQWINQVQIWDIDECFPSGTMISTPEGQRAIETLRVGDSVIAFDEHIGTFAPRRVTRTMCNPSPNTMFDIRINGRHIRCTAGHPFWTRRGWIQAQHLRSDDDLLVYMHGMQPTVSDRKRASIVSVQENGQRVLFEKMRNDVSGCTSETANQNLAETPNLHSLLCDASPERENLQRQMSGGNRFNDHGENEPDLCVTTHDGQQPDAQSRDTGKNGKHASRDRASSNSSRRERSADTGSGTHVDDHTCAARFQTSIAYRDQEGAGDRLSDLLQGRRGASVVEDSNRSGREFTRGAARSRPEERRFAAWHRVESVSVYKPGTARGFVYNIEVDEYHTYIAEGVTVHNCHHVLRDNKWGKGVQLFSNAFGLGVTASPLRCDRKALGRSKSGVFDAMVIGPSMRELIDRGYLADYKIFGPPQSIDTSRIRISDVTGEYNQEELRREAHKSTITGDVVDHYLRLAPGKLGITFTVDVEIAVETAAAFRQKGVPAESVSAKTPDAVRVALIDKFRRGEIKQLVNVDLFGEGMDVPAVEVCSMGRPTQSYGLYIQQFGRPMRPAPGKTHAIVIDHVGNVKRHKLPDRPREWSLDDEERGKKTKRAEDEIPITTCVSCFRAFEAVTKTCPYCGHVQEPASRGAPEFVDGDLVEYSPELLASLGREIARMDGDPRVPAGVNGPAAVNIRRNWHERQQAQGELRDTIALWAGIQRDVYDRSDSESYRRFYHMFGVDVLTAQTLNAADARKLTAIIRETFT